MVTGITCREELKCTCAFVHSGVPQGSVLRPLLFILYVNDIPDLVDSKIKVFADNIKIYTQVTSFSDALSFQNDLDKLCGWAREWLLRFSANT